MPLLRFLHLAVACFFLMAYFAFLSISLDPIAQKVLNGTAELMTKDKVLVVSLWGCANIGFWMAFAAFLLPAYQGARCLVTR